MLNNWYKKEKPFAGFAGFGGGAGGFAFGGVDPINLPFSATGGTKSGPIGGYYYHVFDTNTADFVVDSGQATIEVLVQGAGASGGYGQGGPGNPGGGGGGGGGTSVWTISDIIPGTYNVERGSGGVPTGVPSLGPGMRGGQSRFSSSPTFYVYASGGNYGGPPPSYGGPGGSGGGSAGFTSVENYKASGGAGGAGVTGLGPTQPPTPSYGGPGGSAGGYPAPPAEWWRPYIDPGASTPGGSSSGKVYGGGGGGGNGSTPPGSPVQGGVGAAGRVVIRYPDSI